MQLLERCVPLTEEGKAELALEVGLLEQCRLQVLAEIDGAPTYCLENLRHELAAVDEQISQLRETLALGVTIRDPGLRVGVGSEVTLESKEKRDERTSLTLVGPIAAAPKHGHVSYQSPVGRALLGIELGDWVEIPFEGGRRSFRVVAIRRGKPGTAVR